MIVLFLDVDGVLNKRSDYNVRLDTGNGLRLNMGLVDNLKSVLEQTHAEVVLSSAWRDLSNGREFLESVGIQILDITDNLPSVRGEQIQRWLDRHPAAEWWAIVDDDSDMLPHQLPYFVQTEFEHGLTEGLAYRLIYKLGGEIPIGTSR